MEKQVYNGLPISERHFKARYWGVNHPYPLLPVALEDGESIVEQKIINNMIALVILERKHRAETREAEEHTKREMTRLHKEIRKLENRLAISLVLYIVLAAAVLVIFKALV
jgi:hypothetical protein